MEISKECSVYYFDTVRFKLRVAIYSHKYNDLYVLQKENGSQTILPRSRIFLTKAEFLKEII